MKIIATVILLLFSAFASAQSIVWRVESNFRLLKDQVDQEWLKQIAKQSANIESTQLTTNDISKKWTVVPKSFYDKTSGRYDVSYVFPTEWRIRVSLEGAPIGAKCVWLSNEISHSGSCANFLFPEKIGSNSQILKVSTDTGLMSETTLKIRDILVVGMGDSYASGEGVPDVYRRWFSQSDWFDKKCHRSLYSWQTLTAARIAEENPHNSVTFLSRSCSGALIEELTTKSSSGASGENSTSINGLSTISPQLVSLQRDLCPIEIKNGICDKPLRQPDFILLSIGGNDAKFAPIIRDAILGDINYGIDLKSEYRKYAVNGVKYLRTEYPRLADKMMAQFPQSRVIMTVYPDPLHRNQSAFCGVDYADGKEYLKLKSGGVGGMLARMFGKQERNPEIVALYDDFIVRLTGSSTPIDEDYKGILQIGQSISEKYPNHWFVVPMRRGMANYDQSPNYQPRGYCVPGESVSGRWFLTIDDSEKHIGGISGAVHPNIFGQLYYVSKVYPIVMGADVK